MASSGVGPLFVACVLSMLLSADRVGATGGEEDARAYKDRATAAFALGHHTVAADNFEKAFELTPDPALLYNAAQSHRLAGNKERALLLYENYSRLYGKKERRAEVEARIEELRRAIQLEKVNAIPGPGPGPAGGGAIKPPRAVQPDPDPEKVKVLVPPLPGQEDRSITKKAWFWASAGGAVALAVIVVLVFTLGGSKDPESLGRIDGN